LGREPPLWGIEFEEQLRNNSRACRGGHYKGTNLQCGFI
jgi:hypothetical protein